METKQEWFNPLYKTLAPVFQSLGWKNLKHTDVHLSNSSPVYSSMQATLKKNYSTSYSLSIIDINKKSATCILKKTISIPGSLYEETNQILTMPFYKKNKPVIPFIIESIIRAN